MNAVYSLVRRVPPIVELIGGLGLIVCAWFFVQPLLLAVALLWLALDAASEGLRLRVWVFLALTAMIVIYATVDLPDPPPYHPSIPA